jgi:hypothetical protein
MLMIEGCPNELEEELACYMSLHLNGELAATIWKWRFASWKVETCPEI